MARGADAMGAEWADVHGFKLHEFPADWEGLGRRAGYVRNAEMAQAGDGLLAFWDGRSPGTAHMINLAKQAGLDVRVVRYD